MADGNESNSSNEPTNFDVSQHSSIHDAADAWASETETSDWETPEKGDDITEEVEDQTEHKTLGEDENSEEEETEAEESEEDEGEAEESEEDEGEEDESEQDGEAEVFTIKRGDEELEIELTPEEKQEWIEKAFNLDSEKKTIESELQESIDEFNAEVNKYEADFTRLQTIDSAMEELQASDNEEDHELVRQIFQAVERVRRRNTNTNTHTSRLEGEIKELKSMIQNKDQETTQSQRESAWSNEYQKVSKDYAQRLKEAGIKVSERAVKSVWEKADGDLTVDEAFWAKYGRHITQRETSKKTLNKVKRNAKSKNTKPTASRAKGKPGKAKLDFSKMTREDIEQGGFGLLAQ